MDFFSNIPRGRQLFAWPPTIAFLLVIAALLGTSAVRMYIRERAIGSDQQVLDQRVRDLRTENERLSRTSAVITSPDVIERMAKEQLNLKKPDEHVAVVVSGDAASSSGTAASAPSDFFSGWLGSVFRFFRR